MPIHSTAVRNGIAQLVLNQMDVGTTNATGAAVFRAATTTIVARLNLANPADADVPVNGVATFDAIAPSTYLTTDAIATMELVDRDDAVVTTSNVGLTGSGEEVELSSTSGAVGEPLSITSATYTAPT